MSKNEINEKLLDFYNSDIPKYVCKAGKSYITIRFGNDWDNSTKPRKITIDSVIEYYKTEARNITSGYRSLASFGGDWRYIDRLASECLEWFKFVSMELLRSKGRKQGLEPKF